VYRVNVPVASSQKPTGKVFQQAVNLRQIPFNYAVVFRTKFWLALKMWKQTSCEALKLNTGAATGLPSHFFITQRYSWEISLREAAVWQIH